MKGNTDTAVNSRENLYNDSCEKLLLLLFVNTV
jgi:hypothetical protein